MKRCYTLEMLEDMCRRQDLRLSEREVKEKARQLHKELGTLDRAWTCSNRQFYAYNRLRDFPRNDI